ncbi:hypothetical protein HOG48_04980 [Candidatus Peregrinibacteria bacterium]|jgi:hypothetical protein|nr:hypothetical protein [Candidatus Peregrinibacteria bacterium]
MRKASEEQPTIPTNPDEQLDYLVAHWDAHKNLDGVVLPEGSNPQALALTMISKGMLTKVGYQLLCDTIFCLPVGEDHKPTDWDAKLAEFPPDMVMRALVEHGTPGAISLDLCPNGTLIATAADMRKHVQEGLALMSLQPQRF